MFTAKRLVRLVSVSLLVLGLLVAVAIPTASARGLTPPKGHMAAATSVPATGSCEWFFDSSDSYQDTLKDGGFTYTMSWVVTFYSQFNWATHGYCGVVYETVCLTVPSNYGEGIIAIYNAWYDNGNFVNYSYLYRATSPGGTYCTWGPPTAPGSGLGMAASDYLSVLSKAIDQNSDQTPNELHQTGMPVGVW